MFNILGMTFMQQFVTYFDNRQKMWVEIAIVQNELHLLSNIGSEILEKHILLYFNHIFFRLKLAKN